MEECFVLDLADARVVQIPRVHEAARPHIHLLVASSSRVRALWLVLFWFLGAGLLTALVSWLLVPIIHQATKLGTGLGTLINLLRRIINRVFSRVAIKSTLHQEIEEVAGGRVVSDMAIQVDCPEEGMGIRRCWVWETHQVHRHMSNHSLTVKDLTNWAAYRLHVHIWQWLLWEKAPTINVFLCSEFIHWSKKLDFSIWLHQECNRGWGHHRW